MIVDENLNDITTKEINHWKKSTVFYTSAFFIMTVALAITLVIGFNSTKEVKTIIHEHPIIDNPITQQDTLDAMIVAFAVQESNTTENAVSDCGKYVGCIQMSKIMVDEANRILGYDNFTHDDRFIWDSCARMFEIVQTYHNPTLDIDKAITIWNKGCPNSYRNNVKKVYKGVLRHLTNKQ